MLAGNNRRRRNAARLIVGLLGVVVIGAVMVLAVPHSSPPQDLIDCEERASRGSILLQFNTARANVDRRDSGR